MSGREKENPGGYRDIEDSKKKCSTMKKVISSKVQNVGYDEDREFR